MMLCRENILFGRVYEPGRYEETVRVCGLEPDLQVLKSFFFINFLHISNSADGGWRQDRDRREWDQLVWRTKAKGRPCKVSR